MFDFHTYVGNSIMGYSLEPSLLLNKMDSLGIDNAVICPMKTTDPYFKEQNKYISKLQKKYDRFFGFARVDPKLEDVAVEELYNAIKKLDLKGLILHPWEETFSINDRRIFPVINAAKELEIPVMIETGYPLVSHCFQVGELAEQFSSVKFVMTHGGHLDSSGFSLTDAKFIINRSENIFIETSGVYGDEFLEELAKNSISNRILFGSHSPWFDIRLELKRIKRLHIDDDLKDQILFKNAFKILNLS